MPYSVYGDRLVTGDLSGTATSQRFKLDTNRLVLAIRTTLIVFNSPVLLGLTLHIYADRGGSPGALLFSSSDSYDLADFATQPHGIHELPFEFNAPHGVNLNSAEYHHLVWNASSYVGDENSHVALKKDWPAPINTPRVVTLESLGSAPYELAFVGAQP